MRKLQQNSRKLLLCGVTAILLGLLLSEHVSGPLLLGSGVVLIVPGWCAMLVGLYWGNEWLTNGRKILLGVIMQSAGGIALAAAGGNMFIGRTGLIAGLTGWLLFVSGIIFWLFGVLRNITRK